MSDDLVYAERLATGEAAGLLVLHHGRGADEFALLPLADMLDPTPQAIRRGDDACRLHASDAQLLPPAFSAPTAPRSRGCLEVFAPVIADDCDMEVQACQAAPKSAPVSGVEKCTTVR